MFSSTRSRAWATSRRSTRSSRSSTTQRRRETPRRIHPGRCRKKKKERSKRRRRDSTWKTYYDTVTGVELNTELVRKTMEDEVFMMEKMPVCRRLGDGEQAPDRVIPTKWVLTNKDDAQNVEVRARLVACEAKGAASSEPTLFAATPPLEALRCLVSWAAADRTRVLDFVDMRRAHLDGSARRDLYVRLPTEAGGGVAKLERCHYGTRDAAACWEACFAEAMEKLVFEQGRSSHCFFRHAGRDVTTFVHGDDFATAGSLRQCTWLRGELEKIWELTNRGALGVELREVRILGRLLARHEWGCQWDADPGHAEILCERSGLVEVPKGVSTPGTKQEEDDRAMPEGSGAEARSITMRAAYLALDRPQMQFAVKEAARTAASPTEGTKQQLRRIARYLKQRPRLAQEFRWQPMPSTLSGECDSDFAGRRRTRKSTSAYMAMLGRHCVATRSKIQSVIATSSGEAGFYALCSATSSALGLQALLADLGITTKIVVGMGATAGKAMASRRGLGRAKHIHVQYLWIQSVVASGAVELKKIPGESTRSDLLTRHLAAPRMEKQLHAIGFAFAKGHRGWRCAPSDGLGGYGARAGPAVGVRWRSVARGDLRPKAKITARAACSDLGPPGPLCMCPPARVTAAVFVSDLRRVKRSPSPAL